VGRRSRKRRAAAGGESPAPREPAPRPARAARPGRLGEPPKPPWHPFPLAEICILIAMVAGVVGLITWESNGLLLLGIAAVLGSLATLEFTLREHLTGYRSHTFLLAGFLAAVIGTLAFIAGAPRQAALAVAGVIFAGGLFAFREIFKRRAGVSWRGGFR
jgi:hypothetical protein